MKYAIAVLDIGMTNKKILVYDDEFKELESVQRSFAPLTVKGFPVHDIEGIVQWFLTTMKTLGAKYPIRVISVTTHGATFVCVGNDGKPSVPMILYTYEPGDEFHEEFYRLAGDPKDLQRDTATPALKALINPAKGIYFVQKQFPKEFAATRWILLYPQYYGYLLTGNVGAEPTYIGCHTYLWNPVKRQLSSVVDALGIRHMLAPEIRETWSVLGTLKPDIVEATGLSPETIVTMGIHDSNASLLPYLAKEEGDFVLNSTGTWCVVMHPAQDFSFDPEDIGKAVFFNQAATLKPVKTCNFLGGLEFETYSELIRKASGETGRHSFDRDLVRKILHEKRFFILPDIIPGSGQFTGSLPRVVEDGKVFPLEEIQSGKRVPRFFSQFDTAMTVLSLSLVVQSDTAFRRAGFKPGVNLYIEGGFRKDREYTTLVSSLYPESKVCLTDIAQATSFGAAMIGKMAMEGIPLKDLGSRVRITYTPVGKESFEELRSYMEAYHAMVFSS